MRLPREFDSGRGQGAEASLRVLRAADDSNVDPGLAAWVAGRVVGEAAPSIATIDLLTIGRTPDVRADDAWAAAGRKVLRFHLARVLARVPGILAKADVEEVHAMRVAARRMRAAWRLFGDAYDPDATRVCRAELREIGAGLAGVRDLDVMIEILGTYRGSRSPRQRAGLEPLLAAWRTESDVRRHVLRDLLGSERLSRFALDNVAFTSTAADHAVTPQWPTAGLVRTRVPVTVWAAYERVWRFDPSPETRDLHALHELRIATRWLRYTLEFVRELLEPDGTQQLALVVALQDQLGIQHDHYVAATLAREFTASHSLTGDQEAAVTRFADRLDRSVDRLRSSVGSTWRPVADAKFRRSLGRSIARL